MDKADDLPDGLPKRNAHGLDIMQWLSPETRQDFKGQHLHICDLTGRESVTLDDGTLSYNYTVVTKAGDVMLEVQRVPHFAIILVNRPYSSDVHTLNPFRRWIDIDDQRFPQAWRNLRK